MSSRTFQQYATRNVPRYTSYPTAPHFSKDVGAADYAAWLADLDPDQPISLYLHVPFCRQICWYCGCNMKLASKKSPVTDYTTTLMQEIDLIASNLPGRMSLSHLHWGGGTPTVLDPDDFQRVMEKVRACFDVSKNAELAVECDPRTLSDEMIDRIGALGFTRSSFGVQEFDPKVQQAINRIQPPDMVRRAVEGFRAVGVESVNFDLIYGLPHQTTAKLLDTVEKCVEMRPDRIALFGYAHVPWMAKKQRMIDEAALPDSAARQEQAFEACEALKKAGYVAIGLDHFALPHDDMAKAAADGTLRRNFQGYTTDTAQALLGVGATSISRTPSGFVQNIAETGAWARSVEAGELPVGKGRGFVGQDALRGYVIEQLMCNGTVDLAAAGAAFDEASGWFAEAEPELRQFERDGLLIRSGSTITLASDGIPLCRIVASVFDEYLSSGAARHAVAV